MPSKYMEDLESGKVTRNRTTTAQVSELQAGHVLTESE